MPYSLFIRWALGFLMFLLHSDFCYLVRYHHSIVWRRQEWDRSHFSMGIQPGFGFLDTLEHHFHVACHVIRKSTHSLKHLFLKCGNYPIIIDELCNMLHFWCQSLEWPLFRTNLTLFFWIMKATAYQIDLHFRQARLSIAYRMEHWVYMLEGSRVGTPWTEKLSAIQDDDNPPPPLHTHTQTSKSHKCTLSQSIVYRQDHLLSPLLISLYGPLIPWPTSVSMCYEYAGINERFDMNRDLLDDRPSRNETWNPWMISWDEMVNGVTSEETNA